MYSTLLFDAMGVVVAVDDAKYVLAVEIVGFIVVDVCVVVPNVVVGVAVVAIVAAI